MQRLCIQAFSFLLLVALVFLINGATAVSVRAQGLTTATNANLSPVLLSQAVAPPQFIPTDITPFTVAPERNLFAPGYKFRIFQVLPERLWFNATTEVSQRLDTNVLFTYSHPRADYAFRALPNLTVGYDIFKNTAVYANYFVIKDVFATHSFLDSPTTQSVSMGIRHNKQLGDKTVLQFDFQARELWQAKGLHWFDFLPGLTLTRVLGAHNVAFASTLLQMRGRDYFVAPTKELDPFYTIGYIHSHGLWTLSITDTFVTNFRDPPFTGSVPRQGNVSMITDIEINHPVNKRFPALLAFLRAEPVWNWDSNKVAGISGFDFRFFGGLRLSITKPSYYNAVEKLRKQVLTSDRTQLPSLPRIKPPPEDESQSNSSLLPAAPTLSPMPTSPVSPSSPDQ